MSASMPRTEMSRLSLSLVLAVAGGALAGCGSDHMIAVEQFPAELERRACARAVACRGAESQTACESTVFVAESSGALTSIEAVKRGTVKYDAESARVCLDAITTDCADLGRAGRLRQRLPRDRARRRRLRDRFRVRRPRTVSGSRHVYRRLLRGDLRGGRRPHRHRRGLRLPLVVHPLRRRRLLRQRSNVHCAPPGRRRVPGRRERVPRACGVPLSSRRLG